MPDRYGTVAEVVESLEKSTFTRIAVMDALVSKSYGRNLTFQMVSKQLGNMVKNGELEVVDDLRKNKGTTYRKVRR